MSICCLEFVQEMLKITEMNLISFCNNLYEKKRKLFIEYSAVLEPCYITVFDLITALCAYVFKKKTKKKLGKALVKCVPTYTNVTL